MKLTELDTTTARPRALPPEGDSIHVARLPQAATAGAARSTIREPPSLAFVTETARPARFNARAALLLTVVVVMAAFLWVLLESGPAGVSRASHQAPVRLTPAEQRAAAAARVRTAAIAQAKRDRGTDAELQDTIPAATPLPSRGPASANATARHATKSAATP